MNISEYIYLINKPEAIHDKQTEALEKIVQEFPYFQSARALYLKGLYNQNSFKYNYALKITAAHTADRSVLFDFITSDTFTSIQKELYEQKVAELLDLNVSESEIVSDDPKLVIRENSVEQSILTSIKEAEVTKSALATEIAAIPEHKETDITPVKKAKENLDIGKPLEFNLRERHSFQEWLQLSKFQPIKRDEVSDEAENEKPSGINFEKQKKRSN